MRSTSISNPSTADDRLVRWYAAVAEDEDARVCRDIPDSACTNVPQNFFATLAANSLTTLGDAIANPKTVLAWVLGFVGAPPSLVGLLVPIRESGSLIPQLGVAALIRQVPIRKWIWVAGSVVQGAAVVVMGVIALELRGAAAGWAIISALIVFAIARGFCSVAAKDVLGKTIPKSRRGRLSGLAASIAAVITVGVGFWLGILHNTPDPTALYGWLLISAGITWGVAAFTFAGIRELPGATAGGGNALREGIARLRLLRTDVVLRRFVIARALLMSSGLSAPYYVALAQREVGTDVALLGAFIVANGIAVSASAHAWGRLADSSSRRTMAWGGLLTGLAGIAVFAGSVAFETPPGSMWLYVVLFFTLSIAHSAVRMGRKTYVVDIAHGHRRTDYVAVSNTVIGVLLLASGALGALSTWVAPEGILLGLAIAALVGSAMTRTLPHAE